MTTLFDSCYKNILHDLNFLLEKNDLRYAQTLDVSRVQNIIAKFAHTPFVQTFLKEVQQNWNQYHLLPKFTMINRTKQSSNRIWSFEFGTKRDGYRGFGIQQKDTFFVTDLFSNHRDYDKAVMKL